MIFIYFITILSESKNEITKLIGSQLFLHNSSILFQSKGTLEMPGSLITIPALTRYRIFSIRNLYVHKNLEHLITNSAFLQNFQLKVSSCSFSKFLKSPISMNFDTFYCNGNKFDGNYSIQLNDDFFDDCNSRNENGGALHFSNNISVLLLNCTFNYCRANALGGAVYIHNTTEVTIEGCNFLRCEVSGDYVGGGIYIEDVEKSIYLNDLEFIDCNANGRGAGGVFILNSEYLQLKNVLFDHCYISHSFMSYGGGATILNVSKLYLNDVTAINCSSTYGAGIAVNIFEQDVLTFSSYSFTSVSGQHLHGDNCTCQRGIFSFHFSNISRLSYINITDLTPHVKTNTLIFFSVTYGNVDNIHFKSIDNSKNGGIWVQHLAEYQTPERVSYLILDCVSSPEISDITNIFYYSKKGSNCNVFVTLLNFYGPKITGTLNSYQDSFNFTQTNSNCFLVTGTYMFSQSEEFTFTSGFTQTGNFSISSDFSFSHIFTYSDFFSESLEFSQSQPFTPTYDFTQSLDFTPSSTFSQSICFSSTKQFSPSRDFDFVPGGDASDVSDEEVELRTFMTKPQMSMYDIGFVEKDGKGTKTDLGLTTIYVCIALLAVLLIVVITIAVCSARKSPSTVINKGSDVNAPDEFYFPDFDNFDN